VGYAGLLDLGFVAFWAIGVYTAGWLMSTFIQAVNPGFYFLSSAIPTSQASTSTVARAGRGGMPVRHGRHRDRCPTLRLKKRLTSRWSRWVRRDHPADSSSTPRRSRTARRASHRSTIVAPLPFGPASVAVGGARRDQDQALRLGPFDVSAKYVLFVIVGRSASSCRCASGRGRLGRAWLAIREDELAASMMGVPLMRTKPRRLTPSAPSWAGWVGSSTRSTTTACSRPVQLRHLDHPARDGGARGMGNVWGVMIGALAVAWFNSTGLPQFGDSFNTQFGTNINFPSYNFLIFGSILVLMMLFRREGLFPETRTRQVLQEAERSDDEELDGGEA